MTEAGLDGQLSDGGVELTVLAPNDGGFGRINTEALLAEPEVLESLLGYHVIPDDIVESGDIEGTFGTLSGDEVTVSVVDGIPVVEASIVTGNRDLRAGNGIVHEIDRPLLGNQNLANVTQVVAETEELFGQVADAGLASEFEDAEGWTVFGPSNDAFDDVLLKGFTAEDV